jgi:hypothetical protein
VEENMKKRKITIGLLLIGVLLIGINFLNFTRAKYITESNKASNQARAAKWMTGVTTELDLFQASYATDDTDSFSGANSVESADSINVIAPGTSGSYDFVPTMATTSEAAYKLSMNVSGEYTGKWEGAAVSGTKPTYQPVVFSLTKTVGGTTTTLLTNGTLEALVAEVNKEDNALVYGPNEVPSTSSYYTISWTWPFEGTGEAAEKETKDLNDTELGLSAVNNAGTADAPEVKITASVKAVQVD